MTAALRALAVAAALVPSPPVLAQSGPPATASAAVEAAARLRAADALLAAADGARDRVDALSQTISAYEAGLEAVRAALREQVLREAAAQAELDAEEARLMHLTGLMLALDRDAGAALVLHPDGVLPSLRAGLVLADVRAALSSEASGLAAGLAALSALRSAQDAMAAALDAGLASAQDARVALSEAAAARRDLPAPYAADPAARAQLLAAAETLDRFAEGLAAIVPAAPREASLSFPAARGRLPMPARGPVLRGFMAPDAAGVVRPGLVLATAPGAPVMAPWAATIRYAGPLLDYGNVIVAEPEAGYLLVLAGLGDLYAVEGTVVAPGAVLGTMPGGHDDRAAYFGRASPAGGANRTETLYMELRNDGVPVDPAPWFELAGDATR
jgi:septal ring factor EnvC (AmiA/AmiB activator)